MKIKYTIFRIADTDVHVPSTDYYRNSGDSQVETINTLKFYNESDNQDVLEGDYIILPVYSFPKK